jgi:hypothetical protein
VGFKKMVNLGEYETLQVVNAGVATVFHINKGAVVKKKTS